MEVKGSINFGLLGHEKRGIFWAEPSSPSEIHDKVIIFIPDEFKISKNYEGDYLIDIGNETYLLNDVLVSIHDNCYLSNPNTSKLYHLKYKRYST